MKAKGKTRKKTSIFRFFLIPLIAIMLVQSAITIGALIVRRTARTLEEYAGGMMSRLVENRSVILQNDMNQRWASIHEQEPRMQALLEAYLDERGAGLGEVLGSEELRGDLLKKLFPVCLEILQNNSTNGVFLVLTGNEGLGAGDFDGFFIRDSEANSNPANHTDLLLERGDKRLSRQWGIPMDTGWTTRFHMEAPGESAADQYFYAPWQGGESYPEADTVDLGYWSEPFSLEKKGGDGYRMITYSIPLRHGGRTYAVLGVEISCRLLLDYFPAAELNESQQSGYMLAIKEGEGENGESSYRPLVGKGMLYDLILSREGAFTLQETGYEDLYRVRDAALGGQGVFAVERPLRLYSNNVPYENTQWVLLGLDTQSDLFGMGRQLYIWMVIAVFIGLGFGVLGIYVVVRHLTRPVQELMRCISGGRAGLQDFKPSNIMEIDALYDVVNDLTRRQKEAENILLEEKERYKMALESSKDVFFSYDFHSQMLDLVNHKTMSGKWPCADFGGSFIDPEFIYEEDRAQAFRALRSPEDHLYAEFRLRWRGDGPFSWVALTGKAVYDTDGRRWKLVGSIRNIQEEKEREAERLRKTTLDGVTGLYAYSAGLKALKECRRSRPGGVMVQLYVEGLKEVNEKNGIVFGDMILEELGGLVRERCQALEGWTVALRVNRDEFALWLEGMERAGAEEFVCSLLARAAERFPADALSVRIRAGLAQAGEGEKEGENPEDLIRKAKLAQVQARPDGESGCLWWDKIPAERRDLLPPIQAYETNSLGYGEEVSLVSVALNLFGKGADFPAQMTLMVRKIGRFYGAGGVLVSLLRRDFSSNYLNYQWRRDGVRPGQSVAKYTREEEAEFFSWLGREEVRYFSPEDSRREALRRFLWVEPGQEGAALPLYDSGAYIGNLCIVGLARRVVEGPEARQDLAELGRVIQSQLNQQQHDIASKAKSEFLSRMSHEIRTPMNGIIGMTAIALQPDQSQERRVDCLQKIQSSSNYLLGLINDILDMSKIESGKMKLEPVDFDMNEMLDTIEELIAPQAQAKGIRFVRDTALAHRWFSADQMRISQVLINLLGNAVKFTPAQGRVTLTVRESEGEEGEESAGGKRLVRFAVADTGIGIPKEEQERVFRSFEQAAGANSAKQPGTGLGLSISSRLVQMMGSSIRLDSQPGEGSAFSFAIPLSAGRPPEAEKGAGEEEEISFAGCRVLVVEDNELNAEIARCLLEDRGFEVECAYDGAQAVEQVRAAPPGTYDVILMDIMMPVMDGLDATRAIRAMDRPDCRSIPIIAMSANAFDDDLKKSVECGMNGHLSKPVEVDKLYQMLNQVVRRGGAG